MKTLTNVHPGEILDLVFLKPRRSHLLPDTALRLGAFFKMSPEFWLNAQSRYELEGERLHQKFYDRIKPYEIG